MKKVYDEKLKTWFSEPNCVDEWLEHMWFIGCDYDGYGTVESLKYLIDELVEMSKEARKCLRENRLFPNDDKKVGEADENTQDN